MSRQAARIVALCVAAIVLLTVGALSRFAARDAESSQRQEAHALGERLAEDAEHRITMLWTAVQDFALTAPDRPSRPPEAKPEDELENERSKVQSGSVAQPLPFVLWWSNNERWRPLDESADPDGRLSFRLQESIAHDEDRGRLVGPVLHRGATQLLFLRQRVDRSEIDAVAASQELASLFSEEVLGEIAERGYDYLLRAQDEQARFALTALRSSVRAFEDPAVASVRVLDRAWRIELEPREGWSGSRRLAFAHGVLGLLLALIAGLIAFGLGTRDERFATQLTGLRDRISQLSAQLDLALDDHERAEDRLKQEAHFDPSSGLPNRRAFLSSIDTALRRVRRGASPGLAVAAISFVGLARLRDSLGRDTAEQLIREAAERLRGVIGPDESLGRIGDGDVGITLLEVADPEQARARATQLQTAFSDPFHFAGQEVFINPAFGMARSATQFEPAEQLLSEAGLALTQALEADEECVALFDHATREEAVSALRLESRLRRAIEDEIPEPFFQPIVAADDRRIAGMEVLVRWLTPTEGMIRPDHFVPLAEETGLIVPLDRLVLRRAARQIKAWREELPDAYPFYVSVNLSAYDLREPDVCEYIKGVLDELELPTSAIRLELTESAIIGNVSRMIQVVAELRAMGFKVLLDDFGTGYSSLSYLHKFQFDILKIDQSFVRELGHDGRENDIVRAIVSLASALDLQVVAEGVETEEQYALLKEIGCDYCQGYLFSKPVNGDEAGALLFQSVREFASEVPTRTDSNSGRKDSSLKPNASKS